MLCTSGRLKAEMIMIEFELVIQGGSSIGYTRLANAVTFDSIPNSVLLHMP